MHESLHPIQIERYRTMTPTEKFTVFQSMIHTAREIKRSALRAEHPEWDEATLEKHLAKIILYGPS